MLQIHVRTASLTCAHVRHTLAVCATALALSAGSALAQARAISSPLDTTVRRVVVRPPGYPRITDTASLVSRLRGAFAATRAAPRGMRRPGGAVVALASPYAPDVDLTLANPGASIERSQCVSVALKPRVAYECGALRLAYPLPTLTTLTQARTPTLVYRSDHAAPQPIVRAWVARPAAAPVPTQVTATLTLAQESQPRATATWSGSAWTSTAPQQIALSFDALEAPRLQTQVYGYTLRVTFTFADGATAAAEPTGELAIVNRADSPFGPGWWLAGYESLYAVPDSARPVADYFWVGGDGSTRRFRYAGVRADNWTIWVASPAVDRVDTLSYAPDGWFRRHLGDGAYTRFDGSPRLRHTFTDAPTGHSTQFVSYWNQCGRLGTIWVPTPGAAGPGDWQNGRWWSFNYDADDLPDPACTRPARLTSSGASAVTASGIRWTWVTTTSTWGSFHDQASGRTVYVCYAADRRICGYQDRVGQISDFLYGSGGLFAEARLRTDTTPTSPYFTHRFQPGEAVALAGPRDTLTAVTRLTNPRGFATEIALTRFGAPRRITDATGRTTNLAYGDARFPGLPTWVRTPAYFSSYATYDARGNLTQLQQDAMGGEDFATTRYEYHPVWNRPTVLTSPAGVTEYRGYRADYPALEWAQLGPSPARRTSFGYCASECPAGLLRRVTAPVTPQGNAPTDWYSYDGLGNLRQTLSAAGKERRLGRDRLGRVVRDSTLVAQGTSRPWRVDSIGFDTGDRVTSVTSSAAAIADGAASVTLEVRTAYDSEDRPTSVRRWSLPDPRSIGTLVDSMRHDALGRVVWRRPTGAGASYDSTGYDGAGNVTFTRSRQGRVLRMQYDALDRLTSRRGDPVVYAARAGTPGTPHSSIQFPEYNLSPTSRFATRAVVDTFTYEAETGQLRSARNAAAWVDRYYRLDGRLNAEYLRVNTTNGSDFTKHAYGVGYAYDSAGRQIALQIPWELAPNVTDNLGENYVRYTYEPETGWLSTVRDPLGNTTTFAYNNLGDLQTVNRPGSVMQRFTYSLDGEVQGDTIQRLGATARALSYLRDDIGRVTRAANGAGFSDTTSSIFSPFGHLLATTLKGAGFNYQGALAISRLSENYTLDALGNLVDGVTGTARYTGPGFNLEMSSRAWNYDSTDGSGRLLRSFGDETMSYVYDTDGNTVFVGGSGKTDRADFYNAANQLVASDARAGSGTFSTRTRAFSEFRYDALGRRVWVRTRRMCDNSDAVYGCRTGIVRRTIWDGVQELAEIQQPGNNDESDSVLENDGTAAPRGGFGMTNLPPDDPNPVFGAAVYVHAGALDAPLAILRLHYRQVRPGLEPTAANTFRFRPFMIYPQWRSHGEADRVTLPTGLESHSEAGVAVTTLAQPGGWTPYMQTKYVRGGWYGTLLENKRDQRGLVYRRNRYVDPSAGRFTQEDPIGLSGGLNTYGYAAGDPVTFSDPFGLSPDTVQVGCRAVDGLESFSHCAVRITNDSAGTSTVYELLATGAFARQTAGVQSDPAQLARYNGRWVAVDVPSGQSDNQFAAKARAAADQRSRAVAGRRYSPLGGSNSNRFVYDIVTRAGGQIPSSAGRPGRTAPGLCGGRGIFQGVDCRF